MRTTETRENVSKVHFPMWVEPATPCETRTFRVVATGGFHGAEIREGLFTNAVIVPVKLPDGRLMMQWATPRITNLRSLKSIR